MSDQRLSFIALALRGDVPLDEIDDFVDEWHEGDGATPLHDFLGMTLDEYALWLSDAGALAMIVKARRVAAPATSVG